jgi:hypothetical protein
VITQKKAYLGSSKHTPASFVAIKIPKAFVLVNSTPETAKMGKT